MEYGAIAAEPLWMEFSTVQPAFAGPHTAPLSFGEACELVVDHLRREVPLAFWSVTHYDGHRQIYLHIHDDAYGKSSGDSHAWSDSFCQHMVAGVTPQIAPDAMAVAEYASAGVASAVPIGAYIGIPIQGANGELFGTLCGLDPQPQAGSLLDHAPLLRLCATLLSQILLAEHLRLEAIDREAELHWNAFHDHLTGLPNRAQFFDVMNRALAETARRSRTVMLIDLDDFKAVNDGLGHAAGDSLLAMVARRLRSVLPAGDTLARLGGDEFAILTASADSAALADRIGTALGEPFPIAGTAIAMSASVGATHVRRNHADEDVDSLLARADAAMYRAKRAGKGRSVFHESSARSSGHPAIRLREPLRVAIEKGVVEAHYQAVVDLRTARPIGFEALARWRYADEIVGPDVFVPIAARSGLLPALTEHMLDLACAQIAAWSDELGHHELRVGVNVSAECISDLRLPARVARQLQRHAVKPHQLTLEVTEEALLADPEKALAVSRLLRDIDVRLVLDDFGSGYSSLLRLKTLPLQSIKIDRRFIGDIDTNPEARQFLRALLNLSRDLELAMVVEGVERSAQADALRELGCVYAQGHLYGMPAPAADIDLRGA
jgi:diguanylate cyclase (GGDEF)-like protein